MAWSKKNKGSITNLECSWHLATFNSELRFCRGALGRISEQSRALFLEYAREVEEHAVDVLLGDSGSAVGLEVGEE